MNRLLCALAALALASTASAQLEPFKAGVDYKLVQPAQPTNDSSKVEVVEVFGYLCRHCANLQPYIDPWSHNLPENIEYKRIPVVFQRSWEPLARAYYTAEALGVLEEAHLAVFDALHKARQNLRSNEDLASFFATSFGISEDTYLKTAKSFSVETKLRRGVTVAQRYGVTGTPSVVINGKYLANGTMAKSYERLMEIIDYLVAQETALLPVAVDPEASASEGEDSVGEDAAS